MKSNYKFYDAYNFADKVVQAKLEHFQLEGGTFYGELTQIISDKVIVGIHNMNLPVLQIGTGIKGYITFLIPSLTRQNISWRKFNLNENRIGILKSGGQHFAITPPNFFASPISIRNDYFAEMLKKLGYDERIFRLIQQTETVDLKAEDTFQIQQMVYDLNRAKKTDYDLMTNKLPELILKSIVNVLVQISKQNLSSPHILLSNILIYIQENLNRKISTLELFSTFKISERNLRYTFNEIIGVSPMKYIKIVKLNKTRKDIINAKENVEINLMANKWGFNHSGQFASDYKDLFGEFPTVTKSGSPKNRSTKIRTVQTSPQGEVKTDFTVLGEV